MLCLNDTSRMVMRWWKSVCNYRGENGPASSSGEVHRTDHCAAGDNGSALWCHGQVNSLRIFLHKTQNWNLNWYLDMMPRRTPPTWRIGLKTRSWTTSYNNIPVIIYPVLIKVSNIIKHLLSDRRYPRHALCWVRVSDDFPLALRLQRHQLHHHHHGHHHGVRHPPVRLEQAGAWRVSHSNQLHQVGKQINTQNRNDQI